MTAKLNIETAYLQCIYDPTLFKKTVSKTVATIRRIRKTVPVDAIAFRGSSGAALAFVVGHKLGLSLLHVRKDSSHTSLTVEGNIGAKRAIIIDDFVASGDTINKIIRSLEDSMSTTKVVGLVLYNSHGEIPEIRLKCNRLPKTAVVERFSVYT